MKYLLMAFFIYTPILFAQDNLLFNKKFVECEDKWIVFEPNEDKSFVFGFIYIDEQAGLTLNREGKFLIGEDKLIKVEKLKDANIKMRLRPNNVKVAIIPESMYKELQIIKIPEWLKYYKTDTTSVKRLYKWGYIYNGYNECAKALTYLKRAKEINAKYEGLNVELAFSYNCLGDYKNAINILEEEILLKPVDAYVNKEYIYAISKSDEIVKATKRYYKSLKIIKDKTFNAENCFNIMQHYFYKKDLKNFTNWYDEFKKCENNNKMLDEYAERMNKELIK